MKKRSRLDLIEVKSPCTQDWNRMYGNDQVRFCEHCVKHVHDLSAMTRRKAERFVARAAQGGSSICVRYTPGPDGKVQTASDKLYQITSRASRLAATIFGASLTLASAAYAQNDTSAAAPARDGVVRPETQVKNSGKLGELGEAQTSGSIHGTVFGANQGAVANVSIILTDEKDGTRRVANSDETGNYVFSGVEKGQYTIRFDGAYGFKATALQNIDFGGAADAKYDLMLEIEQPQQIVVMGDIAVRISYENQLVMAVENKDIEQIKHLIALNVEINRKDQNAGLTALHLAVQKGSPEIVELLLNAGAKVNVRDEQRRTPLMMLSGYSSDDVVLEGFVQEGPAPEVPEPESEAEAENTDIDEPKERPAGESAPSATKIFDLLISHGAKIDLRDSSGMNALMHAAQNGETEVVRLLLAQGADVNLRTNDGRTALMDAVGSSDIECVRALLNAGAEVDAKDSEGETAMSLCEDEDIRQLLITHGARETEEPEEEPEDH